MTPAQLLAKLDTPSKVCELRDQMFFGSPHDFATSSNLSVYSCCKQRTCPICGSKGDIEDYPAGDGGINAATYFFCAASKQHIFEVDDDQGSADRVPM